MSKLEGNPFLNWKKIQVTYKGTLYELQAKAFACDISQDGVGYHLRFKDKGISIALIDTKWVRLDVENQFAQVAGRVINKRVHDAWTQFDNDRRNAEKENKKNSNNGTWGIALQGNV